MLEVRKLNNTHDELHCFFRKVELICLLVVDDAPKNSLQALPSLRELDNTVQCVVPTLSKGLDMSILTRVLVPETMVSFSFASIVKKKKTRS